MASYFAYLRVSTQKQVQSGLGLEAQEAAIRALLKPGDVLLGSCIEIESGRRDNRPELEKALAACRGSKATLLIARLDRLSRRVSFLARLMDSDVPFIACDNPNATRLTLHILAAVAEDEARRTSERTVAALAAARARGQVLGRKPGFALTGDQQARLNAPRIAAAKARAWRLVPTLDPNATLDAQARQLNARGEKTARGCTWTATQVMRLRALAA